MNEKLVYRLVPLSPLQGTSWKQYINNILPTNKWTWNQQPPKEHVWVFYSVIKTQGKNYNWQLSHLAVNARELVFKRDLNRKSGEEKQFIPEFLGCDHKGSESSKFQSFLSNKQTNRADRSDRELVKGSERSER